MVDVLSSTNSVRPVCLTSDSTFQSPRIDRGTHTLQTIDYAHHEVHSGSSFHCSDVIACDTTTKYWMVTTPNTTKWAHMLFEVVCTGEMLIVITEGADRTGTTALTCVNSDRNSATTSTLVINRDYSAGTTNGATTIFTERDGAAGVGGKSVMSGSAGHEQEFILKQNTKYIIACTTYASVYVSLELNWYEHTNKEA